MTFIAVTVKEEDGRTLSPPVVQYLPAASIERSANLGSGGSTLKLVEVKEGTRTVGKIYEVFESLREVVAAEDPNSTHPQVNGIVDLALSPIGSVQGGGATVAPYLTEIASASVTGGVTDAIDLPSAAVGEVRVIFNPSDSGGSVDIFPLTGESIDALGVNLPYSLAAGEKVTFVCEATGTWTSVLG